MDTNTPEHPSIYERIKAVVRLIPAGRVSTYGQVAMIVGGCTARMVGYALSTLQDGANVPWQRVINRQGKISPHGDGYGSSLQRHLLEQEGIQFDDQGRVDFDRFGWQGIDAKGEL